METFARVFSSSTASRFPADLAAELKAAKPLIWEESLYASYIKREASEYIHNPSRASIAITADSRLVVLAAGHKQIDIPLKESRYRGGLQVWTEKKEKRFHFKLDLSFYGNGMGGSSLEIRAETQNADRIMAVINNMSSPAQGTSTGSRPALLNAGNSRAVCFPKHLRDGVLAESPIIFEEGLPGSTVLRKEGHKDVQTATPISIAITAGLRLVIVPHRQNYSDFPLTVKWCRDALRVWLEQNDGVIGLEIRTGPFRPSHKDEVTEIRIQTESAARIKSIIDSTAAVQELATSIVDSKNTKELEA